MCMPPQIYIHTFLLDDGKFQLVVSFSPSLSSNWKDSEQEKKTVFRVVNGNNPTELDVSWNQLKLEYPDVVVVRFTNT